MWSKARELGKNPLTSQICWVCPVQEAREWPMESHFGWEKAHGVRFHPNSLTSQAQPSFCSSAGNKAWSPFLRPLSCPGLWWDAIARFCLYFFQHYFSDIKAALSEWTIIWLIRMYPLIKWSCNALCSRSHHLHSFECPEIRSVSLVLPRLKVPNNIWPFLPKQMYWWGFLLWWGEE